MIVKVEEALACLQMNIPEAVVERKIRAIERLIRSETNNNFHDRAVRLMVPSRGILQSGIPQGTLAGEAAVGYCLAAVFILQTGIRSRSADLPIRGCTPL